MHPLAKYVTFDHYFDLFVSFSVVISIIIIPKTHEEALAHSGCRVAMKEEMNALPFGKVLVGCKWIFVIKYQPDGTIEILKARLVVKDFTQTYDIDYFKILSTKTRLNSIRVIISIAITLAWLLYQLDIKNAFLYDNLQETTYME